MEHKGTIVESRMIRADINQYIAQGETLKLVLTLPVNDIITVNGAVEGSPFHVVAPEKPNAATGVEQTPFAKKDKLGVLDEQETNDLFFVIGPGIGQMFN